MYLQDFNDSQRDLKFHWDIESTQLLFSSSKAPSTSLTEPLIEPATLSSPPPQDGASPLFKASHKGHLPVVLELLKYQPSLALLPVSYASPPTLRFNCIFKFTRCFL